jgi:hypothetical protein
VAGSARFPEEEGTETILTDPSVGAATGVPRASPKKRGLKQKYDEFIADAKKFRALPRRRGD